MARRGAARSAGSGQAGQFRSVCVRTGGGRRGSCGSAWHGLAGHGRAVQVACGQVCSRKVWTGRQLGFGMAGPGDFWFGTVWQLWCGQAWRGMPWQGSVKQSRYSWVCFGGVRRGTAAKVGQVTVSLGVLGCGSSG